MTSEKFTEIDPHLEKIARWKRMHERVEQVKDKLGKGVDEGIKETVVAFLANEFPVCQSCEGHLEERSGKMRKIAPYIDVETDEPKERFVGESEIRKNIAKQSDDVDKAYWDYISENHIQETLEYQKARIENEALKKNAEELISEFYSQYSQKEPPMLRINSIGPSGRFRIEGAQGFVREVPLKEVDTYSHSLSREQADMAALTNFLKKKFFEGLS